MIWVVEKSLSLSLHVLIWYLDIKIVDKLFLWVFDMYHGGSESCPFHVHFEYSF